MKTKKDILNESFWTQELSGVMEGAVKVAMDKWADQEKAALKEKIRNHVVSKLAEYERDDDGDPWYNGAKTEMEELRKWLNAETLK